MKKFEPDYIKKLIGIMQNNEITEMILEEKNASIVIKSNGYKPIIKEKEESIIEENETIEVVEAVEEEVVVKNRIPVISNMIGLFYSKPSPNEEPFVKVGDEVSEEQIVCIIETIKLMNKITSPASGKVVEICIEDGQPVEYGQVIMYIEEN